jgi:hypothetical protein
MKININYLEEKYFSKRKKDYNFPSLICLSIFISFSMSPEPFLSEIDDRNYLNIYLMFTVNLLFFFIRRLNTKDIALIFFVIFVSISSLLHESTSWTSSIYLFLFCSTFLIYSNLIRYIPIKLEKIITITSIIIFAFFFVLLVQQISVLTNMMPPLAGNYDSENPFKLSSLSAEPSAAAISVGLITYFYIETINYQNLNNSRIRFWDRKQYFIVFSGLWVLLTNGSSTGILMAAILAIRILPKINFMFFSIFSIATAAFIIIYDPQNLNRFFNTINSIYTLDIDSIVETDHSASYRFIPAFILLSIFEPFTIGGLFGLGNTFVGNYLHTEIPGTPPGHVAGGFASVLIQYGLIASTIFLYFLIKSCCRKGNISDKIIIILMLISINGINSQLFWFSIIILSTIKLIYSKNKKIYEK